MPGLRFDVMPMPIIDSPATVGDITGLCISAGRREPRHGGRLHRLRLSHRVGRPGRPGRLPRAGQPRGRATPTTSCSRDGCREHAAVFNSAVALDADPAAAGLLGQARGGGRADAATELVNVPILDDLPALTEQIDAGRARARPARPSSDAPSPATARVARSGPAAPSASAGARVRRPRRTAWVRTGAVRPTCQRGRRTR